MDDNSRPHRAKVINENLQQETIECINCPVKSISEPESNNMQARGRFTLVLEFRISYSHC